MQYQNVGSMERKSQHLLVVPKHYRAGRNKAKTLPSPHAGLYTSVIGTSSHITRLTASDHHRLDLPVPYAFE